MIHPAPAILVHLSHSMGQHRIAGKQGAGGSVKKADAVQGMPRRMDYLKFQATELQDFPPLDLSQATAKLFDHLLEFLGTGFMYNDLHLEIFFIAGISPEQLESPHDVVMMAVGENDLLDVRGVEA